MRQGFGRAASCRSRKELASREQLFLFFVGTDPEPDHLVCQCASTDCTVFAADAHGNKPIGSVNLLEPETGMARVLYELTIGCAGLTLNVSGQGIQQPSEARRGV